MEKQLQVWAQVATFSRIYAGSNKLHFEICIIQNLFIVLVILYQFRMNTTACFL